MLRAWGHVDVWRSLTWDDDEVLLTQARSMSTVMMTGVEACC